jgi:formate dehydrogenase major subunit/NADH-quinone oxidoreductase subunit G
MREGGGKQKPMKKVTLTIDGKKIKASEGQKILYAALENGIYIPNLCAIREKLDPPASCRLCFIEVEGEQEPVTACTEPIREGMVVYTRNKFALRLARTAAELLLSNHPLDCSHCSKSRSCELLKIAKHLGIKVKTNRFRKLERNLPIDDSLSIFTFDPNKCVLCGKCVWVCQEQLGIGAIGFTRRGFKRVVSTYQDKPLAESTCTQCGECVKVCPVGALTLKDSKKVQDIPSSVAKF